MWVFSCRQSSYLFYDVCRICLSREYGIPVRQGRGICVYKDPILWSKEGLWYNNELIHGRKITSDAVYEGHFQEDQLHGFGSVISFDANNYEGEWHQGIRQGHGKGKVIEVQSGKAKIVASYEG